MEWACINDPRNQEAVSSNYCTMKTQNFQNYFWDKYKNMYKFLKNIESNEKLTNFKFHFKSMKAKGGKVDCNQSNHRQSSKINPWVPYRRMIVIVFHHDNFKLFQLSLEFIEWEQKICRQSFAIFHNHG